MPFSVSFTFKASNQYSKIVDQIAKSTRTLNKELRRLQKAANHTKNLANNFTDLSKKAHFAGRQIKGLGTDINGVTGKFARSSSHLRNYTRNMNYATRATNGQIAAVNRLNSINSTNIPRTGAPRGSSPRTQSPAALRALRQQRASALGTIGGAALTAGVVGLAPLAYASRQSMQYETAFSQVRKVAADNITDPRQMKALSNNILGLSTKNPFSGVELSQITAAAAGGGIGDKATSQAARVAELTKFTDLIARASVAFDVSTEKMGTDALVLTKTFDLSASGLERLGDQINYLDNQTAAKGRDIIDIVSNIAGAGKAIGFKPEEVAAFATTLKELGIQNGRAGKSLKDLFGTFAEGGGGTKKSIRAIQAVMGMPIKGFTAQYKNNPLQTTIKFLERIRELNKTKDGYRVITDSFGKQYASEIVLLADRLDSLKNNLNLVRDSAHFSGSMLREYQIQAATTANQLKILGNNFNVIATVIGDQVNKQLGFLLKIVNPMVKGLAEWSMTNPHLITGIVEVTAALSALLILIGSVAMIAKFILEFQIAITTLKAFGVFAAIANSSIVGLAVSIGAAVIAAAPWIVALAVIAAGVSILYNHNEKFRNSMNKLGSSLVDFVSSPGKFFSNWLDEVGAKWQHMLANLSNFQSMWSFITNNPFDANLGNPSVNMNPGMVNSAAPTMATFMPGLPSSPTNIINIDNHINAQTGETNTNVKSKSPGTKVNLNSGKQMKSR